MTDTDDTATHDIRAIEIELGKPVVLPLKAERIQLVLLALDRGNRSSGSSGASAAESEARLEAATRDAA